MNIFPKLAIASLFAFAAPASAATVVSYEFEAEIKAVAILPISGGPALDPTGVLPDIGAMISGSVTASFDEAALTDPTVDPMVNIIACSFAGFFCGVDPATDFGSLNDFDDSTGLADFSAGSTFSPGFGTYEVAYNFFGTGGNSIVGALGVFDGRIEFESSFFGASVTAGLGFDFTSVTVVDRDPPVVPLPGSMMGLAGGLALLGGINLRRRSKKKAA